MNLNIVIFGASGPTGLALTRQALARGYRVTAITRRPAAFELNHEGHIIPG
ncbi:MAG: NAD(P)H-binding protein, partial [Anaerolineales bacterium]|nr:NAD(P)H-binding protein [Anaerolineales bacterium]